MRLRRQRRARKQLRKLRGEAQALALAIARLEKCGLLIEQALRTVMLDPARTYADRAGAGTILTKIGDASVTQTLLALFFEQVQKEAIEETALALEDLGNRRAIPPLARALLNDANPHRRLAAARALGRIHGPSRIATRALSCFLLDRKQSIWARQEAAESLGYVGTRAAIEPLISALRDPEAGVRFWAVFGLATCCRGDARAVLALESVLDDDGAPQGEWWSVGREALAMLAWVDPPVAGAWARLAAEINRVHSDASATDEQRRWAEYYPETKGVAAK